MSQQQKTGHDSYDTNRLQRKRLAQMTSANLVVDPSSTCHRFILTHPGLSPGTVDQFGNPSTMGLVQLERASRQMAIHSRGSDGRCFADLDVLRESHMTFVASAVYDVTKFAYDTEEKKHPLRVQLEVGHVGRTSFSAVNIVTLPSERVMMTSVHQIILIHPTTRRPAPLPEPWLQHFQPLATRQEKTIVPRQYPPVPPPHPSSEHSLHQFSTVNPSPSPPSSSPSTPIDPIQGDQEVRVRWSDTDHNQHTNYTSYIRFALDAVYPTLYKGTLNDKHLSRAELESGVAELKVAYLGESLEGDLLHVRLWSSLERERTVVCSMDKEGGQPVCQVTLTFHSPKDDVA